MAAKMMRRVASARWCGAHSCHEPLASSHVSLCALVYDALTTARFTGSRRCLRTRRPTPSRPSAQRSTRPPQSRNRVVFIATRRCRSSVRSLCAAMPFRLPSYANAGSHHSEQRHRPSSSTSNVKSTPAPLGRLAGCGESRGRARKDHRRDGVGFGCVAICRARASTANHGLAGRAPACN